MFSLHLRRSLAVNVLQLCPSHNCFEPKAPCSRRRSQIIVTACQIQRAASFNSKVCCPQPVLFSKAHGGDKLHLSTALAHSTYDLQDVRRLRDIWIIEIICQLVRLRTGPAVNMNPCPVRMLDPSWERCRSKVISTRVLQDQWKTRLRKSYYLIVEVHA